MTAIRAATNDDPLRERRSTTNRRRAGVYARTEVNGPSSGACPCACTRAARTRAGLHMQGDQTCTCIPLRCMCRRQWPSPESVVPRWMPCGLTTLPRVSRASASVAVARYTRAADAHKRTGQALPKTSDPVASTTRAWSNELWAHAGLRCTLSLPSDKY